MPFGCRIGLDGEGNRAAGQVGIFGLRDDGSIQAKGQRGALGKDTDAIECALARIDHVGQRPLN